MTQNIPVNKQNNFTKATVLEFISKFKPRFKSYWKYLQHNEIKVESKE